MICCLHMLLWADKRSQHEFRYFIGLFRAFSIVQTIFNFYCFNKRKDKLSAFYFCRFSILSWSGYGSFLDSARLELLLKKPNNLKRFFITIRTWSSFFHERFKPYSEQYRQWSGFTDFVEIAQSLNF